MSPFYIFLILGQVWVMLGTITGNSMCFIHAIIWLVGMVIALILERRCV